MCIRDQFFQPAKPAEQRTLGQPPAHPAIIFPQQSAQHIATQSTVTVPLVAGAGLGFGGGELPVETREALFDERFFHAAQDQELINAVQTLLEILVIAIAQDLSLIHISEPTRLGMISYAVFCLKKKKKT